MAVDKKHLLKMLDDAIALEDRAIPVYSRHLKTALFWSGLPPEEREHLRIQLNVLEKESLKHIEALGRLRAGIERDPRDVF